MLRLGEGRAVVKRREAMTEQDELVIAAQENIWTRSGRRGLELLQDLGYSNEQIVHSAIGYVEDETGGTFILPYIEDGELIRVDKIALQRMRAIPQELFR